MLKRQLNYKNRVSALIVLYLIPCMVLAGCASSDGVSSFRSIGKNDVLVVGKVLLEPPLSKDEMKTPYSLPMHSLYGKSGNINLYFKDTLTQLEKIEVGIKEARNSIGAAFGELFFVKMKRKSVYFYYSYIIMGTDVGLPESLLFNYLPAGWKLAINDEDKAVYIGTIKYTRDEFFRITKVEIIDEYDTALKDYYAKFGTTLPLKKSLLEPM